MTITSALKKARRFGRHFAPSNVSRHRRENGIPFGQAEVTDPTLWAHSQPLHRQDPPS